MKRNGIFSKLFLVLVFAFLYAPILVLIVFSFVQGLFRHPSCGYARRCFVCYLSPVGVSGVHE